MNITYKYPFLFRLISYVFIWFSYLYFMDTYAPLGINWLSWHEQRIINFSEFLRVNGYLSFNGFSIWSECDNCQLSQDIWRDKIYITHHSISYLPYLIANHFFGKEALMFFGPLLDKFVIFITGIAISEIGIDLIKEKSKLPSLIISMICFSFFAANPWTYKMLLAAWTEIYFLMFFLLGLISFNKKYNYLGLFLFFCSALSQWQWAFLIAAFYIGILGLQYLDSHRFNLKDFFAKSNFKLNTQIIYSLIFPTAVLILIRIITQSTLEDTAGSSILFRAGISGVDIHNGGLLGALQFLGGNRITRCLEGVDLSLLSSNLEMKIMIFNCILSIGTMFIISIISIIGIFKLNKEIFSSRTVILPLLFALISMIFIFQQSLSVHLMGYSYVFSPLFAIGLTSLFSLYLNSMQSSGLKIIFLFPITIGILITCIRVSMLTGANG